MSKAPARLALQTGRLDDHRGHIEPGDALWERAHGWFLGRDKPDAAPPADDLRDLCERWPYSEGSLGHPEAVAVTVALASPFADRERILRALDGAGGSADAAAQESLQARIVADAAGAPRPHLPRIYDPDSEQPAPIVAVLDGPQSPDVAALLEAIKQRDEVLAEAIVLGADLETLESLDRLALEARRAGRPEMAAQFEHDREHWKRRAEQARARQRLEGSQYGWRSDNFPPGCLEAARAEIRHEVDVLLEHPPPG